MDRKLAYGAILAALLVLGGLLALWMAAPAPAAYGAVVRQSGGAGMLVLECLNESYLAENSDYVIEGKVERVESGWNEGRTSIFTYTDFAVESYAKGTPFANNRIRIVTPGGTVGEISQAVENQPILHEGARARLYLEKISGEFTIFCGRAGVAGL